MKKRISIGIIVIMYIALLAIARGYILKEKEASKIQKQITPSKVSASNFNMDIIKTVNSKENGNYLISPYSIEIALNMLKEGAEGETFNEINKVVQDRNITTFDVKNKISVANSIFVKNSKKAEISQEYINKINTSYKADLIYDDFVTPDKINKWANQKTFGMIPKILDEISSDFVLGLANAVAIDVEWNMPFKCKKTSKEDFIEPSGVKKVEMMNNNYQSATYILNDNEQGIILTYRRYLSNGEEDYENTGESTQLEFVAIMPTKDNVKTYINNMTNDKLNNILNSTKTLKSNQELNLKIPRFEYDYTDDHFIEDLNDLGIKKVFDKKLSDLGKMKSAASRENLYVKTAIHKTHISLNEKGTKAAAITYFGVDVSSAIPKEPEYINIELNKPFMYIIRDKKTKEMLFFGVVESPNEWKGSTCVVPSRIR